MAKTFKGRPVVAGSVTARALVSHGGFNTLASFQKSLLAKKTTAVCSDQNNADLYGKVMTGKGISTDVLEASLIAYINATNKLLQEE